MEDNLFTLEFLDLNRINTYSINEEYKGIQFLNKDNILVENAKKLKPTEVTIIDYGNGTKQKVKLLSKGKNVGSFIEDLIIKLEKYNKLGGFIHETSLSNLKSIYDLGALYSRDYLEKNNVNFKNISSEIVRSLTKSLFSKNVRFHLRPLTPDHYMFANVPTCILVCDYSILLNENKETMYLTNKIATKIDIEINPISSIDRILKYDFATIFKKYFHESEYEKDCKGAEFLVKDKVDLKYITKIIFKNSRDHDWFKSTFKYWKIEALVNEGCFERRKYDCFFK